MIVYYHRVEQFFIPDGIPSGPYHWMDFNEIPDGPGWLIKVFNKAAERKFKVTEPIGEAKMVVLSEDKMTYCIEVFAPELGINIQSAGDSVVDAMTIIIKKLFELHKRVISKQQFDELRGSSPGKVVYCSETLYKPNIHYLEGDSVTFVSSQKGGLSPYYEGTSYEIENKSRK